MKGENWKVIIMANFEIYETKYGYKVGVHFEYDEHLVKEVKSLSWDKTHRRWRPDRNMWEMDINKTTITFLRRRFNVPTQILNRMEQIVGGYEPTAWLENDTLKIKVEYSEETAEILTDIGATFVGDHWELERAGSNINAVKDIIGMDVREKDTIDIVVYPVHSVIESTLHRDVDEELYEQLSFRPANAEWAKGYRKGTWDGFIHMYSRDGSFPTGLLPLVRDVTTKRYNLHVKDHRTVSDVNLDLTCDYELRDYQQDVIGKVLAKPMGTISMPAGSGKTVLALKMIAELGKPTLILTHRQELLYQWIDEITGNLNTTVGQIGDGEFYENYITIGMLQTLTEHKHERDYDVLIADEVHHIPAQTFRKVANSIDAKYRYGLSATPFRTDNKEMMIWSATGPVAAKVEAEELAMDGWLAKPKFIIAKYGGLGPSRGNWHEIYERNIVENYKRNNVIANIARYLNNNGYETYVDVHRITHGEVLTNMIGDAKFICGEDSSSRRQAVLDDFSKDNFVLVSTLIKEGVDLPDMNAIILAGGMKSSVQVIQTIGRTLRPKQGNNIAFVVDMKDEGKYIGSHFKQRKDVMRNYYGVLYHPDVIEGEKYV